MAQNTQPQQGKPGQQNHPAPNNPTANPNQGGQQGQKRDQQNLGGKQEQEQDLTKKQTPTQGPNQEEGMKASAERRHRVGEQEQEEDEEEETKTPQSKDRNSNSNSGNSDKNKKH